MAAALGDTVLQVCISFHCCYCLPCILAVLIAGFLDSPHCNKRPVQFDLRVCSLIDQTEAALT